MARRRRRTVVPGLLATVLLSAAGAAAEPPRFENQASERGLDAIAWSGGPDKNHILESTGNGIVALDYDRDGDQDLFLVHAFRLEELGRPSQTSRLYRNDGDRFVDVTASAGVGAAVYGHGGCVGDADGDGLTDLYVTAFGANLLYLDNGDGTFREGGATAAVAGFDWSIGCTFFDADGDGDHDLYVADYIEATWEEVLAARRTRRWRERVDVMDGPRGLPEATNRFYRNLGDGTFEEATEASGLGEGGRGYSMGVASFDFDRDGAMDLYVANDSTPNRLYRNRGDGTFEEVGGTTGSAYNADGRAQGSMGVGVGDYDGDGWLDLAVTNFAHDYYSLYRNARGVYFLDDSFAAGTAQVTFAPLGWAASFFDADNDGDLDLFFANGHIYPQVDDDEALGESYRQLNQLLLNEGGLFVDRSGSAGAGLAIRESSRGAALIDLGNDGALDLAVSNQDAPPSLLVADAPRGRWLGLVLGGPEPLSTGAPFGLGAVVEVAGNGLRALRQVRSGAGYASQDDLRVHVGLGTSPTADRVTIHWPGGAAQRLQSLPSDRYYVVAGPALHGAARREPRGGDRGPGSRNR